MVVAFYKSILIYNSREWIISLNTPNWALSYVPFTALWIYMSFFLVLGTFRAFHASEYKFGLIQFQESKEVFYAASVNIGFIITLFHMLMWSQQMFNNRNPQSALLNGIIFELALIYSLIIYFILDIWAGIIMIPVVLWGFYILAYNYYIIKNNTFN